MSLAATASAALARRFGRLRVFAAQHPRLTLLVACMHAVVFFNAFLHDPRIGYDAAEHLRYVDALAAGRLPSPADSAEFFSPPLPYVVPALVRALGGSMVVAGKAAQLAQALLSLVLAALVVVTASRLGKRGPWIAAWAIAFVGSMAVYYRSFAFVRGEPLLAVMTMAIVAHGLRPARPSDGVRRAAVLGLLWGLALLCRQWAVFLLPAVVWAAGRVPSRGGRAGTIRTARDIFVVIGIAFAVAMPFYGSLKSRTGSALAFNRAGSSFSFRNQPAAFYSDLSLDRLFTSPVRNAFPNRLWPILYSELWGDYWCSFAVYGERSGRRLRAASLELENWLREPPPGFRTNYESIQPYLGRVNLWGLIPSVLLAGSLIFGLGVLSGAFVRHTDEESALLGLLLAIIGASLVGYFAFLIVFPHHLRGNTIKATYLLHTLAPLSLVAGWAVERVLSARFPWARRIAVVLLAIAAAHNCGAWWSRFWWWPSAEEIQSALTRETGRRGAPGAFSARGTARPLP